MGFLFVMFVVIVIAIVYVASTHQSYHSAGERTDSWDRWEQTDTRRSQAQSPAVKTLYTSTALLTLHHRIEITDENGLVVYRAETQFPSLHDKTDIYRADGSHVAHIERKLISLHEIRYIDMEEGVSFRLSNELLHIIRDVTNIEGLGWLLEGNILQLNFSLKDGQGKPIALVGQKMFSLHDKYSVDLYQPEHEKTVVAILVALQHMICDREAASASGSAGSNG